MKKLVFAVLVTYFCSMALSASILGRYMSDEVPVHRLRQREESVIQSMLTFFSRQRTVKSLGHISRTLIVYL